MRANPVGWFEIYVNDMVRARLFYETVFDVKVERLHSTPLEMWGFPIERGTHGSPGALVRSPKIAAGETSVVVYFSCDDCAVEEARVTSAGGRVLRSKTGIGEYGYMSLVLDSENNQIGLHSLR